MLIIRGGGEEGDAIMTNFLVPDRLIVRIFALHTGLSANVLCFDFALLVNMSAW